MILILDNAPYHHKRGIPSLTGLGKKPLIDLIADLISNRDQHLLLPFSEDTHKKRWAFSKTEEGRRLIVVSRGIEYLRVPFIADEMKKRGNGVLIPDVDDLKKSFLMWLATHRPELLDDKVQTYLASKNHEILWTPPYVPELQPIEIFWGVGKNYAGYTHYKGRSMRETVADLRDGWYGNVHWPAPLYDAEDNELDNTALATVRGNDGIRSLPVNCNGLIEIAIKEADKRIAWCPGIKGSVYNGVTVDAGFTADAAIPIDLVFDASIGDINNPILLAGNISGEHHIDVTQDSDDESIESEDLEDVTEAASILLQLIA